MTKRMSWSSLYQSSALKRHKKMQNAGAATNPGRRKKNNEDAFLAMPEKGLFAVADGVGGSPYGEAASALAVDTVKRFILSRPTEKASCLKAQYETAWYKGYFTECVHETNRALLLAQKEEPEKNGMCTTLVMAYIKGNVAYAINVGDSRAYILREGTLYQKTNDHSLINKMLQEGKMIKEDMKPHKVKNVITKAIGLSQRVFPDIYRFSLCPFDKLILCTDGLYAEVSEERIASIVLSNEDPQTACDELIKAANDAGGKDNITVVLYDPDA